MGFSKVLCRCGAILLGWTQLLPSCIYCSRRKDVSEHNDLFLLGIFASCHQDASAREMYRGLRPCAPCEAEKAC